MCPCWSKHDLVEGGVSLEVGFGVSNAQARPSDSPFLCLLPADLDVELSATLQDHVCLHATMLPTMVTMDTVTKPL